jgi:hypothetical protein
MFSIFTVSIRRQCGLVKLGEVTDNFNMQARQLWQNLVPHKEGSVRKLLSLLTGIGFVVMVSNYMTATSEYSIPYFSHCELASAFVIKGLSFDMRKDDGTMQALLDDERWRLVPEQDDDDDNPKLFSVEQVGETKTDPEHEFALVDNESVGYMSTDEDTQAGDINVAERQPIAWRNFIGKGERYKTFTNNDCTMQLGAQILNL